MKDVSINLSLNGASKTGLRKLPAAAAVDFASSTPDRPRNGPPAVDEQYRLLFELNPNPMWIFDERTQRFLAVNDAAVKLYGWSHEEFLRLSVRDVRPPEEVPKLAERLERQRGSRVAFMGEWRHWKKDHTVFDVEVTISCLQFEGREARLTMVNDITERRRAEERLQELNATLERRVAERTEKLTRAHELLQAGEQALADFFAEAPFGLLWVGPGGQILRANPAQAAMLGYRLEELRGRQLAEFSADPHIVLATVLGLSRRKKPVHDQLVRMRCRDGAIRHAIIDANGLWQQGKLIRSRWFVRDVTRRLELEREILLAGERVRRRIGQDLHDDLCQQLTSIEFLTRALERQLSSQSRKEAGKAHEIAQMTRQAITHTRELSHTMSPMELETDGLAEALRTLAARTERLFHIDCRFCDDSTTHVENHTTRLHLYRIAQEAINNALKHGKAGRIEIDLRAKKGQTVLTVLDNGVGLPPNPRERRGAGLRIMDYRASALGGSLVVANGKKGGTTLVCSIPDPETRPVAPTP